MASFWNEFNETLENKLNESNSVTEILNKIENATNVKKIYIVKGFLVLFGIYMVLGHFAELLCNLVGFAYPAYASIHALESPGPEDDKKWLTYWVVFSFFNCLEFFSDFIFSWFPFYWLFKVGFLVWSFAPYANNGSMVLYHKLVRPFFLRNKSQIDNSLSNITKSLLDHANHTVSSMKME